MLSPSTLSLLVVAAVFVGVFAAFAYYQSAAADAPRLYRYGLTPRRTTVASVLALLAAAVVAAVRLDTLLLDRRTVAVLALWTLLLVTSANGVAGAAGFAQRWRAFHPASAVPTGAVSPGPVAVSGTATDEAVARAPVTGRDACCFVWRVTVEDPYVGTEMGETGDFREVAAGQGGPTFALDDGSGPVHIDPAGARLDIGGEQTVELAAGDVLPRPHTDAISDVEFDHGDSVRRYTERVAGPGDSLAVAGEAVRRDGRVLVTDAIVTTGSLSQSAERYRARALLYGVAGLGGMLVALWGLLGTV